MTGRDSSSRLTTRLQAPFAQREAGFTLVEELVTVAVIGLGLAILVAMITTGAIGARKVNDLVVAETLARSQIELIKDAAYRPNPQTSPYPAVTPPTDYNISLDIEYWNAASGSFTGAVRNDGLQKITVTVSSDGETLNQTTNYKVDR